MRALLLLFLYLAAAAAHAQQPGRADFEREVSRRLTLPADVQDEYAMLTQEALARAGVADARAQFVVTVDRSRFVQAAFVYWRGGDGAWRFIGASPASTGRPGEFEHFLTPLGVFAHSLNNPDFRAEGTLNDNGIRGYGAKGMRVFDFGWVDGERTWGQGGRGVMRLQLHATDADKLEPLLGQWHSKGCIRIPASLDAFLDRYGLLDADYEAAMRAGEHFWVLPAERTPTPTPGRGVVVHETTRNLRPAWARP